MTHTYEVKGMTCGSCVARVKSQLLKLDEVKEAEIQLTFPQAKITMLKHLPLPQLQSAISKAGNFQIKQSDKSALSPVVDQPARSWFATYKPILIIAAYIFGLTIINELLKGFVWENWMLNFMAAFFLTFSFFKMLDLHGFADSYATYDIIARHWKAWGYVYVVLELALGLAFLFRFELLLTYGVTIVVMSQSLVGVLQSVLKRQKIRCACLGTVFNLPMSSITVLENGLMILMSVVMLITML